MEVAPARRHTRSPLISIGERCFPDRRLCVIEARQVVGTVGTVGEARSPASPFLTRQQLADLLAEIPEPWRAFFELLACTGPRISEAIALRIMDADVDAARPSVHVRRAIVNGELAGPKSRHGRRTIPISRDLAQSSRRSPPTAAKRS